jgi:DNA-binding protein H-NS
MADIDLEGLSLKDLKQLQKDVAKAINTFEDRHKVEARVKVEAFARELGYPLSELISVDTKAARQSGPPKYQHPENPTLTWTGRGRKPGWFVEALAAGKTEAELAIA